jgi:hypothetical protein
MAKKKSKYLRTEDGKNLFRFLCVGCDAEGELGIKVDDYKPFGCPERCGATYIQHKGVTGRWQLTAVVAPIRCSKSDVDEAVLHDDFEG